MPAPRDAKQAIKIVLLLRLYPRRWRERYGEEFFAHLSERPIGAMTVIDIAQAALGERVAALFKPDRVSTRRVARGLTRFVVTLGLLIALIACGTLAAFGIATALSASAWSFRPGAIAVPALLLIADVTWFSWVLHRRRRAGLPHAGPLGPMTPRRLAAASAVAIAILALAKWIQWNTAASGSLSWASESELDRVARTLSYASPIWFCAMATLHYFRADLIYVPKPPDVARPALTTGAS